MPAKAAELPQTERTALTEGDPKASTVSTRKRRRSRKLSRDWMPAFLNHYARFGIVKLACDSAGIDRTTAYAARDRDKSFAEAWEMAREDAIEELEAEALRRALDGSDTLIIFMLKSLRPDKYRERIEARSLNLHEHRHTVKAVPDHPEPKADAIVEIVDVLAESGRLGLPPGAADDDTD